MSGSGVRGDGSDHGDQLFIVDRLDVCMPACSERRVFADDGVRLGFIYDHVQCAARCHGAARAGCARGDEQQVLIGRRCHIQISACADIRIGVDLRRGFILCHDYIEGARAGIAGPHADGCGDGKELGVGIDSGVLREVTLRVDGGMLPCRIRLLRDLALAAFDLIVSGLGFHLLLVDQQRDIHACGSPRSRCAHGACDDPRIGSAAGIHAHVAVAACDHAAGLIDRLRHLDLRRADLRVYFIVEINHREGARTGEFSGSSGVDRTGDRFSVIVGAGQEVQQVDALYKVIAGDFDLDRIALAVRCLLHVDDAGLGIAVRIRGISDQAVHAPGIPVIVDGHHLLVGKHTETVTRHAGAVADGGLHFIVADDGGKGRAHAHAGTLRYADAARADGHLALVSRLHFNGPAVDNGVVLHLCRRFRVADKHRHRTGDSDLSAASRHGARQGLRSHQARIAALRILGQSGRDLHIPCHQFTGISFHHACDGAGHFRIGLVAVNAHRHTHGDGVAVLCQRDCRTGSEGAEIPVVAGQDSGAQCAADHAVHTGICQMLADRHADSRSHLYLLGRLTGTVRAEGLTGGTVRFLSSALCLPVRSVGSGLVIHILRFQGVGRYRGILAGRLVVAAVFALLPLLVHLIRDAVIRGVVIVIIVISGLVVDCALGHLINRSICCRLGRLELLGVPFHIRAHGGRQGIGLVLAAAGCEDIG